MNEMDLIKEDELNDLRGRVTRILDRRDLPEEIKEEVKALYREYEEIYRENADGLQNSTLTDSLFENDLTYINKQMELGYWKDCDERCDDILRTIKYIEGDDEKTESRKKEDLIDSTVEEKMTTRRRILTEVTLVQDTIQESRRSLIRMLEFNNIPINKIEEVNDEIRVLINKVEERLGNVATESFELDDKDITARVLNEYEEYLYNINRQVERRKDEPQSPHQEFAEEIRNMAKNRDEETENAIKMREAQQKDKDEKESLKADVELL